MRATVITVAELGVYVVSDELQRKYRVRGDDSYRVGDSVLVLDGNIIGKSNIKTNVKVFKV